MIYVECGCCNHFHRDSYTGDCRQDTERFTYDQIPSGACVLELEEQRRADSEGRKAESFVK